VPPVDDPLYHRYQFLIYPITSPLFVCFSQQLLSNKAGALAIWQWILIIGPVISVILVFAVRVKTWKAQPRWVRIDG